MRHWHAVTGMARGASNVEPRPNLSLEAVDVNETESLAPLLEGYDVVVSSSRFVSTDPRAVIAALKKAQVPRLMVVGGAGSLEVASGVTLINTPRISGSLQAGGTRRHRVPGGVTLGESA